MAMIPNYPLPLESEDMTTPAGIKAYAKRVIDAGEVPTQLPQDPWLYFTKTQSAVLVKTDSLVTEKVTDNE
jgi:hypothetical protein